MSSNNNEFDPDDFDDPSQDPDPFSQVDFGDDSGGSEETDTDPAPDRNRREEREETYEDAFTDDGGSGGGTGGTGGGGDDDDDDDDDDGGGGGGGGAPDRNRPDDRRETYEDAFTDDGGSGGGTSGTGSGGDDGGGTGGPEPPSSDPDDTTTADDDDRSGGGGTGAPWRQPGDDPTVNDLDPTLQSVAQSVDDPNQVDVRRAGDGDTALYLEGSAIADEGGVISQMVGSVDNDERVRVEQTPSGVSVTTVGEAATLSPPDDEEDDEDELTTEEANQRATRDQGIDDPDTAPDFAGEPDPNLPRGGQAGDDDDDAPGATGGTGDGFDDPSEDPDPFSQVDAGQAQRNIEQAKGGEVSGTEIGGAQDEVPIETQRQLEQQLEQQTVTDLEAFDIQVERTVKDGEVVVEASLSDEARQEEQRRRRELGSQVNEAEDRAVTGINRRAVDAFTGGEGVSAADEVLAERQLEQQLEEQTGADLEAGEDFVVEQTDAGFEPRLTDSGQQAVEQQAQQETQQAESAAAADARADVVQQLDEQFPEADVGREDVEFQTEQTDEGIRVRGELSDEGRRSVARESAPLSDVPVIGDIFAAGAATRVDYREFREEEAQPVVDEVVGDIDTSEVVDAVGDIQLVGSATEPAPTEGSGPTVGETSEAATETASDIAESDAAQTVRDIQLVGSATEPAPTKGSGPTASDIDRESVAAASAVGVASPEPISTAGGLIVGGTLVGGAVVARELQNQQEPDIEAATTAEIEVPDEPLEQDRAEIATPEDGNQVREIEVPMQPGDTVSADELGLPEEAFQEQDGEIPVTPNRDDVVISDGEIELPADTTAVAAQERYEEDEEEEEDAEEEEDTEEEKVIVEVPEEFIPEEEVTIGAGETADGEQTEQVEEETEAQEEEELFEDADLFFPDQREAQDVGYAEEPQQQPEYGEEFEDTDGVLEWLETEQGGQVESDADVGRVGGRGGEDRVFVGGRERTGVRERDAVGEREFESPLPDVATQSTVAEITSILTVQTPGLDATTNTALSNTTPTSTSTSTPTSAVTEQTPVETTPSVGVPGSPDVPYRPRLPDPDDEYDRESLDERFAAIDEVFDTGVVQSLEEADEDIQQSNQQMDGLETVDSVFEQAEDRLKDIF